MKKMRCSTVLGRSIIFSLALLLSLAWAGLVYGQPGLKGPTTTSTKQTPTTEGGRTSMQKTKLDSGKLAGLFAKMEKVSETAVSTKGCADGVKDVGANKAWLVAMGAPGGGWARVEFKSPEMSLTEEIKNIEVHTFARIDGRVNNNDVKIQIGVKSGNEEVATKEWSGGYSGIPAYNPLKFDMKANKKYHAYVRVSIDASTPDEVKSAVVHDVKFLWKW